MSSDSPAPDEVDAVIETIDRLLGPYSVRAIILACRRVADGLERALDDGEVELFRIH